MLLVAPLLTAPWGTLVFPLHHGKPSFQNFFKIAACSKKKIF